MRMLITNVVVSLSIFVILLLGIIYLQLRLSRSENKYVGLVLPIIFFLLSFSVILSYAGYYEMVDGVVTEHTIVKNMNAGDYIALIFSFLIANIPTIVLMAIYLGERSKISTRKAIEKMKIEDL